MKTIAFSVPIFKYKIKNWNIKKEKILDIFNGIEHKIIGNVITGSLDTKMNVFSEEIKLFEEEIGIKFNLTDVWFQKYDNNMDHSVHNHGPIGFSSVCYINFNKRKHNSTIFISPFTNPMTGDVERFEPEVDEGDIIFFPSNLLHYAPVNISNEMRLILSFNLRFDSNQNRRFNYQ